MENKILTLMLLLILSGCTPPREKARLQEKMRCLDEATASASGALDLLQYELANKVLSEDDFTMSLNYVQMINKQDTDLCESI